MLVSLSHHHTIELAQGVAMPATASPVAIGSQLALAVPLGLEVPPRPAHHGHLRVFPPNQRLAAIGASLEHRVERPLGHWKRRSAVALALSGRWEEARSGSMHRGAAQCEVRG